MTWLMHVPFPWRRIQRVHLWMPTWLPTTPIWNSRNSRVESARFFCGLGRRPQRRIYHRTECDKGHRVDDSSLHAAANFIGAWLEKLQYRYLNAVPGLEDERDAHFYRASIS